MSLREKIRALAAGLALLAAALPVASQEERTALYEENERVQRLVARIVAPTTEGAGVLFHVDGRYGYGFTAKHVLFQRGRVVEDLEAVFQAWPSKMLTVTYNNASREEDLAVFKVDLGPLGLSREEILKSLPLKVLGTSKDLDPGDELASVGHSSAGAWITPKEWLRFSRKDLRKDAFLFEYACPQGHSGGPVFNKKWELVGMMIDEEAPFCRALGIDLILKAIRGWKLNLDLDTASTKERGPEEAGKVIVAVVGFDNRSGKHFPDLGAVAQDAATSFLYTLPGVTLVTRDRLDEVRKEIKLPESVLAGTGVSRAGKLLNADLLMTGSVVRYDVERRTFEGFGTSALQDIFRMEISLQLIDAETGQIRFGKTFDTESTKQYPKATSAPREPIDRKSELLRALLDMAQNDVKSALMQVAAGSDTGGGFIQVPVESSPAGAEIIVNGLSIGKKTPAVLSLTVSIHEIELLLPGYQPYKRRIKAQPGMRIDASLVRKYY